MIIVRLLGSLLYIVGCLCLSLIHKVMNTDLVEVLVAEVPIACNAVPAVRYRAGNACKIVIPVSLVICILREEGAEAVPYFLVERDRVRHL